MRLLLAACILLPTRYSPGTDESILRVPPGFDVQRITTPDLVKYPLMASFDEEGRLYVGESSGLNVLPEERLKRLPDRILRLEDSDGDGKFDKQVVFADKLTFVQGVLWHAGAVYTCAPPNLWKLEDTDGDGSCDKRTEIVTRFGFTGKATDIHGPMLSPSGWLYWNSGRHEHSICRQDGTVLKGTAARIFRSKPDGAEVEVVCGGGMDNAVSTAFTAEGEALSTVVTLERSPQRMDAIIHAVEGGVFPYHEQAVGEFKRTGNLLGPVADLGWVAPAGMARYQSDAFGRKFQDNFFTALFNTRKVLRNVIEREGATFKSRNEDFLVSTSLDFHPTDVLEDADGSLIVIDTGAWFKTGCPSATVQKAGPPGGIYRIRRSGAPRPRDPRGLAIDWKRLQPESLVPHLHDSRFVVRDRAVASLARYGTQAVPALTRVIQEGATALERRHAVWALSRIPDLSARRATRLALKDKDPSVRLAAAHSVGLHRDSGALFLLIDLLRDEAAPIRREAATALARLGRPEAVQALLEGVRATTDPVLEHALIYALIRIGHPTSTQGALGDPDPKVRRAALIALDQMDAGGLSAAWVTPLLESSDSRLKQAALNVIASRPGWAKEVLGTARTWLSAKELNDREKDLLRGVLLSFAADAVIQDLVARTLRNGSTPVSTRLVLLEMIVDAALASPPATWLGEARWSLDHDDDRVVRQAIRALRGARSGVGDIRLRELAADESRDPGTRLVALAALAPRMEQVEDAPFEFLLSNLDSRMPPLHRLAAAEALGLAPLNERQLLTLTVSLGEAGGLELPKFLPAFGRSSNPEIGRRLLEALLIAPGFQNLTPTSVRKALESFPEEIASSSRNLINNLDLDRERQLSRLAELQSIFTGGDPSRGRAVFFSHRTGCSTCHAMGAIGGGIGPDLSKIGGIRAPGDLLESIVFPSSSFVRNFEPYIVRTKDGEVHSGIISRDSFEAITLLGADRREMRIPRRAIEAILQSRVSIMPQGLDASMSRQELADLVAFLSSVK